MEGEHMAFIQENLEDLETAVTINVDHIVAVYDDNGLTIIQTTNSSNRFTVQESYQDIVKRIETAQVYGPK
jgi:hypothetical protein